jgi:shikimate kinase
LKTGEPLAKLEQLFMERDPLYKGVADIIVDSSTQSVASLAHRVEQQILQHQSGAGGDEASPLRMAGTGGNQSC